MTTMECQTYMMWKYGLKWETTSNYVKELAMSQIIKQSDSKWVIKTLPKEFFG